MNKDLKNELEQLAPKLSKLDKRDLEVPEGYFDSFSDRLMSRIKQENIEVDTTVIRMFQWKKYFVAAIVLVTLGASLFIYQIQSEEKVEETGLEELYLSELDEEVILDYTYSTASKKNTKIELEDYHLYIDEQSIIEEL